jgi:hypothetical protein
MLPRDGRRLRLVLVSPKGPLYRHRGGIFRKSLRYQPLTLTTLAALIPPHLNAEVTLIDEGIQEIPESLDADLVGLTVITGTAPRAYDLARHFRSRGIATVLGGPHVTQIRSSSAMPKIPGRNCFATLRLAGCSEDTTKLPILTLRGGRLRVAISFRHGVF